MDHLRGGWLQAKPHTGTCICSPKRASTTGLLQSEPGQRFQCQDCGSASNPLPVPTLLVKQAHIRSTSC